MCRNIRCTNCKYEQQAIERVGGEHGHKGEEAAITAIKMIALNNSVKNKILQDSGMNVRFSYHVLLTSYILLLHLIW